MAEYGADNKFDISTSWGDSDPVGLTAEQDNHEDRERDGAGVPSVEVQNKFDVGGRLGDSGPFGPVGNETGPKDFAADGAGVPNPNMGEQSNWDMALEPNKFPRETGHDSLSGDEVIFS